MNNKHPDRKGEKIYCANTDCSRVTIWGSPSWSRNWLSAWDKEQNRSFDVCSLKCAAEIKKKKGRNNADSKDKRKPD